MHAHDGAHRLEETAAGRDREDASHEPETEQDQTSQRNGGPPLIMRPTAALCFANVERLKDEARLHTLQLLSCRSSPACICFEFLASWSVQIISKFEVIDINKTCH